MAEFVWVSPQNGKTGVPIGARVLAKVGSRIHIKDDDLNERWVAEKEILGPMHPTSIVGVEDMTYLGELQEYSILRNIQIRYRNDLIYTYVGSILVAVNPYKTLAIYGKNKMAEYRKRRLGELPPHIFAVADHSYESMRKMSEKRCIVVSGESGGGKTESTKLFLQYFATISPKRMGKERQILGSNPILEAFGNAKTVCNDNSSRFGKYISIYFNNDGSIHSAEIKHYLLEKSRIVFQSSGEENYHIFYALLNGLKEDEKRRLKLKDISHYKYLNAASKTNPQSTEPNANHNIQTITSAMKELNFSDLEIWQIFELLAAILHFGNIEFETAIISNVETVKSIAKEVRTVCYLLQVPEEHLTESLTRKTISTHGDSVVKFLSKQEAVNCRDALVKKIFGNLFSFIVDKINENLSEGGENTQNHIGILDIFGFEAFERNSFEQLCINYANERLQQFFIGHVFKIEQQQYASEGITWNFVDYPDNQEILDLIEAGPKSILSVINDSTKIPRGTDQSMLDKLIEFHSENSFFFRPKFKNTPVFGIQHFAGIVLYDTKDFIEKNYDSYSLDIKQVVHMSGNDFLKKVFASDFETESNAYYKKRLETLASKFKNSLDQLMNELNECQPFFVRCIKPNETKRPQTFDRTLCYRQLQYSGLTEVTRVREAGYPVRFDFFQFVQQYRALVPGMPLARKTECKTATHRICQTVFKNYSRPDYQLGRTKVFLKHDEALFLEAQKEKVLYSYAVTIQKMIRGWLQRRRHQKLKKAVLLAEKCWRERQRRVRSYKTRHGLLRLQAKLKSRQLVLEFVKYSRLLTRLQARCKGYLIRNSVKRKLQDAHRRKQSIKKPTDSVEFKDFARRYFQNNQSHKFSKKAIKTSLTRLVRPEEVSAAKAIWWTILRYTRNVSEPRKSGKKMSNSRQLKEILQINGVSSAENADLSEEKVNRLYDDWLKSRTTDTQKIHFVIGHGIKRPSLRDEIYCQICKMLTNNPSNKGAHRGWELLSTCVGCFPPSDLFLPYLKSFIRKKHNRYTSFCLFRLHRVIQNGCRTRPPFATELQAIRQLKPVHLEVLLKNGAAAFVKIDSATTTREMLDSVAKSIKLVDTMGFSIILVQEAKQMSLGGGASFVLDAISKCEEYASEVEGSSDSAPWKLYLKKEMFAPWQDSFPDEVSSNLIYHQIKEGIATGDYGYEDPNLPSVIAQVCYAEAGYVQPSVLNELIRQYSPMRATARYLETLEREVESVYQRMFAKKETSVNEVRAAIIEHAALNWTLQFSRYFNVYGSVTSTNGTQASPEVPVLLGMCFFGIFIIEESNEIRFIAKIEYPQIQELIRKPLADGNGYTLKITTYEGMEVFLTFLFNFDDDFHGLLNKILETLKKNSKFVMSVKDYKMLDESFLELQKGDFITLTEGLTGQDLLHNAWGVGFNKRTEKTGNFLLDSVMIIPAVKKPSQEIVSSIREAVLYGRKAPITPLVERCKHYTLESYAKKFFMSSNTNDRNEKELWRSSKKQIQQPLLAKTGSNPNLSEQAVAMFRAILQYSEAEQENPEVEEELIRKIFNPGLENDDLKEETYCQIMKQLTSNADKQNENKTWELMWLVTGLYSCGETLANEVKKFLQSRRTIHIARECLLRFYQMQNSKTRACTPHPIEIEAVKNRPCHIFHRVCFPDGTNKFFKVHSLIEFKELREAISSRLNLNPSEGFQVLVQISERLFLPPEDYYLFDYLQGFRKWIDANKMAKEQWQYKICFMKCTQNTSLSSDEIIDLKFIFPQEYNKYIQGYYQIPTEDIIQLAALLYKLYPSDDKTQQFQKILQKLIPLKAINQMKMETWQNEIQINYKNHYLLTSTKDCKIQFLKHLSRFSAQSLPYFAIAQESSNLKNYMLYSVTQRSG